MWGRVVRCGLVLNVCVCVWGAGWSGVVGFDSQTKGGGLDPEGLQSGSALQREAACRRLNTQDQVGEEAQLGVEASQAIGLSSKRCAAGSMRVKGRTGRHMNPLSGLGATTVMMGEEDPGPALLTLLHVEVDRR